MKTKYEVFLNQWTQLRCEHTLLYINFSRFKIGSIMLDSTKAGLLLSKKVSKRLYNFRDSKNESSIESISEIESKVDRGCRVYSIQKGHDKEQHVYIFEKKATNNILKSKLLLLNM